MTGWAATLDDNGINEKQVGYFRGGFRVILIKMRRTRTGSGRLLSHLLTHRGARVPRSRSSSSSQLTEMTAPDAVRPRSVRPR